MRDKTLVKYLIYYSTWLCWQDFALSDAISGDSIRSFATVIGAPAGIAIASIRWVFLARNGISKAFLKTRGQKETNTEKLFYRPEVSLIA